MRDERLTRGIDLFNTKHFYEAHEVLEDVWRESRGPERKLLQAVIQAAVALHHHSCGNNVGAHSLMTRAARNLEGYPEMFAGIQVTNLLGSLGECTQTISDGLSIPEFEIQITGSRPAARGSQRNRLRTVTRRSPAKKP